MIRRRVTILGGLLALLPTAALADPAIIDPNGLSAGGDGFFAEIGATLLSLAEFFLRLV